MIEHITQYFNFWPKFQFLTGISIFDRNFDFWPKFPFFTEILIFDWNFDFLPKFWFLTEISIFYRNFDFLPKFRFFTEISIFYRNFDFLPKFRFFTEISIFDRKFDFWSTILNPELRPSKHIQHQIQAFSPRAELQKLDMILSPPRGANQEGLFLYLKVAPFYHNAKYMYKYESYKSKVKIKRKPWSKFDYKSKLKFWLNVEILVKNRNFGQKS